VFGGWTLNDRVLSNRDVYYGLTGETATQTHESPVQNTFYYDETLYTGLSFHAYSWVSAEDYPYRINCSVVTSIFD